MRSIALSSSIKFVGAYAFFACFSLSSVSLPTSISTLAEGVFQNCDGLSDIKLPSSLVSIGVGGFLDCLSLSVIALPKSLMSIGAGVFENCPSLSSITLPLSLSLIGPDSFGFNATTTGGEGQPPCNSDGNALYVPLDMSSGVYSPVRYSCSVIPYQIGTPCYSQTAYCTHRILNYTSSNVRLF